MLHLGRWDIAIVSPKNPFTIIIYVLFTVILLRQAYNWYKYRNSGATLVYSPRGAFSLPKFRLFKGQIQKAVIQKNYPLNWGFSYIPSYRLKLYAFLFTFTAVLAIAVLFLDVKDNFDNTESTKQFNTVTSSIVEFFYSLPKKFRLQ